MAESTARGRDGAIMMRLAVQAGERQVPRHAVQNRREAVARPSQPAVLERSGHVRLQRADPIIEIDAQYVHLRKTLDDAIRAIHCSTTETDRRVFIDARDRLMRRLDALARL